MRGTGGRLIRPSLPHIRQGLMPDRPWGLQADDKPHNVFQPRLEFPPLNATAGEVHPQWEWFPNTSDFSIEVNATLRATSLAEENEIEDLYRVVVPVLLTICFVSCVFNLTIVCSARCLRRTLSPTICLSLSLAVADAYASLVVGLGLVVNSLLPIVFRYDMGSMGMCYILSLEAFRLGGLVVSVLHLLALAVNHYIGILRPLHYAHIVTRGTTMTGIGVMWVLPVVFFLLYFASIPDDGFRSPFCSSYRFLLHSPFRVTTSLLFFAPLLAMTLMYAHMFVVVRRHQKGLLQGRQLHRNVKAVITTLLILGTYVLGWMPAVLFYVSTCLDCPMPFPRIPLRVTVAVSIFNNAMIVLKSLVDPVIYVVRMPEIKSALRAVWSTRCGRRGLYSTPSHSRTDTRRLTLLASRGRGGVVKCRAVKEDVA